MEGDAACRLGRKASGTAGRRDCRLRREEVLNATPLRFCPKITDRGTHYTTVLHWDGITSFLISTIPEITTNGAFHNAIVQSPCENKNLDAIWDFRQLCEMRSLTLVYVHDALMPSKISFQTRKVNTPSF